MTATIERFNRLVAILISLAFAAPALAQSGTFPSEPPVAPLQKGVRLETPFSTELENGLDVLVITSDEIPWVTVGWYLLAGAKFDSEEKSGTASLTAQMLSQGTKNYSSDAFSEKADFNAVSVSGNAGYETTNAFASGLSEKVDLAVELLAEAVRRPVFPQKDFDRLHKQTLQGQAVAEQDGSYQAGRVIDDWLYGDHFRARPSRGDSRSLVRITRDDLAGYHAAHYMPNYSTLIFSGDIQPDQAVALAKKYFGDWQKGRMPSTPSGAPAPDESTRIVVVDRSASEQVQIRMGHRGFPREDPDYVASRVFNQIFGGSFVSRLNKRIRVEEGLTYGARGGFDSDKDTGVLTVSTFTRPEAVRQTVGALQEVVQETHTVPPSDEELSDGKSYIIGSFSLSMETPQDVAGKVWELKYYDLPYDYYDSFLKEVEAVTGDTVRQFARENVRPEKLKIVVVGRAEEVVPQLKGAAPVSVMRPGEEVPPPPAKEGT